MKKVKSVNLMLVIAIILVAIVVVFLLNYILNYQDTETNYFSFQETNLSETNKNPILGAQIKKYNLSAFEFVAAVSKDESIENGEFITDTGNKDGIYSRAPNIKKIESNQIIYEKHSKDALNINTEDYILYTTRIYNEGNTNGYASKITKTLPKGLEFITTNEEYNGIWNLEGYDNDGRQKITTTWIAKGQGEEINSVEGDNNYNKNLIKAVDEQVYFIDVQVLCKVTANETNRVLVNYSEITENTDEYGTVIVFDELNHEDDNQDLERIKIN